MKEDSDSDVSYDRGEAAMAEAGLEVDKEQIDLKTEIEKEVLRESREHRVGKERNLYQLILPQKWVNK